MRLGRKFIVFDSSSHLKDLPPSLNASSFTLVDLDTSTINLQDESLGINDQSPAENDSKNIKNLSRFLNIIGGSSGVRLRLCKNLKNSVGQKIPSSSTCSRKRNDIQEGDCDKSSDDNLRSIRFNLRNQRTGSSGRKLLKPNKKSSKIKLLGRKSSKERAVVVDQKEGEAEGDDGFKFEESLGFEEFDDEGFDDQSWFIIDLLNIFDSIPFPDLSNSPQASSESQPNSTSSSTSRTSSSETRPESSKSLVISRSKDTISFTAAIKNSSSDTRNDLTLIKNDDDREITCKNSLDRLLTLKNCLYYSFQSSQDFKYDDNNERYFCHYGDRSVLFPIEEKDEDKAYDEDEDGDEGLFGYVALDGSIRFDWHNDLNLMMSHKKPGKRIIFRGTPSKPRSESTGYISTTGTNRSSRPNNSLPSSSSSPESSSSSLKFSELEDPRNLIKKSSELFSKTTNDHEEERSIDENDTKDLLSSRTEKVSIEEEQSCKELSMSIVDRKSFRETEEDRERRRKVNVGREGCFRVENYLKGRNDDDYDDYEDDCYEEKNYDYYDYCFYKGFDGFKNVCGYDRYKREPI